MNCYRALQAASTRCRAAATTVGGGRPADRCWVRRQEHGYRRDTRLATANSTRTTTVHTDAAAAVSARPLPGLTRVRRFTVLPGAAAASSSPPPLLQTLHVQVASGFAAAQRGDAALLFWQAFEGKLGRLLRPVPKALAFLEATMDPGHAICATSADGKLLGIAGYRTYRGGLTAGSRFRDLVAAYGVVGALWRGPFHSLLDRPIERDTLLMDGIFVADAAQGRGVGTRLLEAIKDEARARNLSRVRLDVVDSNPRARALYGREGFVAGETSPLGVLRLLFNYSSSTSMVWRQDGDSKWE